MRENPGSLMRLVLHGCRSSCPQERCWTSVAATAVESQAARVETSSMLK